MSEPRVIRREVSYVIQRRYDGARPGVQWVDTSASYWVSDSEEIIRQAVAADVERLREIFGEDNVRAVRRTTTTIEEVSGL